VTAFTDRCPGLRRSLADAGITTTPILDWFHIGMRLQHLKQIAGALSADHPARVAAKAAIVAEVELLHWRTWNGKAKNASLASCCKRTAYSQLRRAGCWHSQRFPMSAATWLCWLSNITRPPRKRSRLALAGRCARRQ